MNNKEQLPREPFQPERLIDSDEAASMLGIHPKTLQRMARQGAINAIRVGRLWRFRASWIDEWINCTVSKNPNHETRCAKLRGME